MKEVKAGSLKNPGVSASLNDRTFFWLLFTKVKSCTYHKTFSTGTLISQSENFPQNGIQPNTFLLEMQKDPNAGSIADYSF
ncbi:MAG: hypothetical protein ABIO46_04050 [Chitinophagales bacterium]